jgi:hypothetical protein
MAPIIPQNNHKYLKNSIFRRIEPPLAGSRFAYGIFPLIPFLLLSSNFNPAIFGFNSFFYNT